MSQWGQSRTFTEAGASLTAVPHVESKPFAKAHPTDRIDDVLVVDFEGDRQLQDRLTERARQYVGGVYADWIDAVH